MLVSSILVGVLAVSLVSCGPQPSDGGVVVERVTKPLNGVDLRVKHDRGKERLHGYTTPQLKCTVGARWPNCVQDEEDRQHR